MFYFYPMAEKQQATQVIDHLFRNEFGKAVAYLTGKFGPGHLSAAEDAVQDALMKAMQSWPFGKVPNNPTGWIIRVANNKLIDQLRRQQKVYYATQLPETSQAPPVISEELFNDEMVKMIFACCNPAMSTEHQLILTLKILGGLSIREIAAALLKKEETIAKAYTRAKKKFKEENPTLEIPTGGEIQNRLAVVLKVLYLLFNEGYKCTEGNQLIRKELCEEAMRLNHILLDKPETNNEWTRAHMALMHYHVARFDARTDEAGEAISLEFQDRSKWDPRHIELGNRYLNTIPEGYHNEYFIQAAISGIHVNARSYEQTDWPGILTMYNLLYSLKPNPLIALYRIIPVAMTHGPGAALSELSKLEDEPLLIRNHLLAATRAEIYCQLADWQNAKTALQEAIEKAENDKEKAFLNRKLAALPTS